MFQKKKLESFIPNILSTLEQSCITVWRLPLEFSQSRFGGREIPSNACTLIVIALAENFYRNNVKMPSNITVVKVSYMNQLSKFSPESHATSLLYFEPTQCSPLVLTCYLEAIVTGNNKHENALRARKKNNKNEEVDPYFTIPDALIAVSKPFMEIDFCSIQGSVLEFLPRHLRCIIHHPQLLKERQIYIVMIAYQRSILFVYERSSETLTLVDTHLHGSFQGGLIASCRMSDLRKFSEWICFHIFPESIFVKNSKYCISEIEYELSVLHFCGNISSTDCVPCPSPNYITESFPIFSSRPSSNETTPEKENPNIDTIKQSVKRATLKRAANEFSVSSTITPPVKKCNSIV